MRECSAPIEFPTSLWNAMGLERKVLHIARSHFFPDCEFEEPSTSYKLEASRDNARGAGRGFRSRSSHNSRSSSMSASRKVRVVESDRAFHAVSGADPDVSHHDEWECAVNGASEDSAALLQPLSEPSFELPSVVAKGKRSFRRRSRANVPALLAAIDGGVHASSAAHCQLVELPGNSPELAVVLNVSRPKSKTAPVSELVEVEATPAPVPVPCKVESELGILVEVAAKRIKWQGEEVVTLEEKGSGTAGNVSTSHSASSSQGGFAIELSSPERISAQQAWSDCSDDLN